MAQAQRKNSLLPARIDAAASALFVFPLFVIYQIGIITSRIQNGVDFVTRGLVLLCRHDLGIYLLVLTAAALVYAVILYVLSRRGTWRPTRFIPVVLESFFYALLMGSLIVFILSRFARFVPGLAASAPTAHHGFFDVVVLAAGAGFHEELIFRAVIFGGMIAALSAVMARWLAFAVALLVSSLVFSAVHHLGALGEPFTLQAFCYRTLAGVYFALLYRWRGFAICAWTHAIYDVFVMSLA